VGRLEFKTGEKKKKKSQKRTENPRGGGREKKLTKKTQDHDQTKTGAQCDSREDGRAQAIVLTTVRQPEKGKPWAVTMQGRPEGREKGQKKEVPVGQKNPQLATKNGEMWMTADKKDWEGKKKIQTKSLTGGKQEGVQVRKEGAE